MPKAKSAEQSSPRIDVCEEVFAGKGLTHARTGGTCCQKAIGQSGCSNYVNQPQHQDRAQRSGGPRQRRALMGRPFGSWGHRLMEFAVCMFVAAILLNWAWQLVRPVLPVLIAGVAVVTITRVVIRRHQEW